MRLEIFNLLGQQVALLVDQVQEASYHTVQLDGKGLASGLYLYRLQAGEFIQTRKLLMIR